MSPLTNTDVQTAAVTGAGSGLGRDIALGLATYIVFGTAMSMAEVSDRVDIYRMEAEGKAVEHWDTLRPVGTPQNSGPLVAPNIDAHKLQRHVLEDNR